jgi:glycosyltransferase involved in cell wall biosynthesis
MLSQGHILVNTSKQEGFSNTFIQAWMRKVPVVSLQVDPDSVLEKEGIGFCSGSFDQLVKDTQKLITDDKLRNEMGERARAYAIKNHSLKNMDKILDLMAE